ncbi:MAG: hypothetical protein IKZ82_00570 [Clostridia bacterium]|nr:hypothetical protein [Clostridia bacterium]
MKRIPAWVFIVSGLVLGVFSVLVIDGDMRGSGGLFGGRYTYKAPFTAHELLMLLLVLVAIAIIIYGIVKAIRNRRY